MNLGKTKLFLQEYLTFSKSERNGSIVLLSLITITILMRYLIPYFVHPRPSLDPGKFEKEIGQFEQSYDSVGHNDSKDKLHNKTYLKTYPIKPSKSVATVQPIEINSADSTALDQLPGIGPVLAQRILKYRRILGGFYTFGQLGEVYGLKPETLQKIEKYITVDTAKIQKIMLNSDTFKKINAHPYISYEQTKAIFKLRAKQKISSIYQLNESGIFSGQEMGKIRPYLVID